MNNLALIDTLNREKTLDKAQWVQLLSTCTEEERAYAADLARRIAQAQFGTQIFFRGIIEFTNVCKNDCLYCGIRRSNTEVRRYRLSEDEILDCCRDGYGIGFRTFVLQGGEDPYFDDQKMCGVVSRIRAAFPDCAITLSLGERSGESYQWLYNAGADRYLLRHETADCAHYGLLHPAEQSWQNRMECLNKLKQIGFQTGCGMMIGAPYQTPEHLAEDMLFLKAFQPHMIGTGPFLPHHATPFRDAPAGSAQLTLLILSLCRMMLPRVLLPATTALGTLKADGRVNGILAGCNVIMPNLSPRKDRKDYMLYDGKPTDHDAAETLEELRRQVESIGYQMVVGRGDFPTGQ